MKGKLSDPSPFNNILNNIQFLLAVVSNWYKVFLSLSWGGRVGVLVSLCEVKGNKNEGKWKGNERKWKWKGKLSDPSPFINNISIIYIQCLLVVVGIKYRSYL